VFQSVDVAQAMTCAATTAGRVWCTGRQEFGQLGDARARSSTLRALPWAELAFDSPVVKIQAGSVDAADLLGSTSVCALSADGHLRCWGDNDWGQLGRGEVGYKSVPQQVAQPAGGEWTAVGTGVAHTCATLGGAVYCWGRNTFGESGADDATYQVLQPHAVVNGGASALAVGRIHNCAIADGRASCWGSTGAQQIVSGSTAIPAYFSPVAYPTPGAVSEIAAGDDRTCVNSGSQTLCTPTQPTLCQPQLTGLSMDAAVGGLFAVTATSSRPCVPAACARGGTDCCDATTGACGGVLPPFLPFFQKLDVGNDHSCGIVQDNSLLCWGDGSNKQLGKEVSTPDFVWQLDRVWTDVSAGLAATCAIRSGRVVCWGANAHGEVGLSADMVDALPTEIALPANQCATAISMTWRHACAITVDDVKPADGCTPNGATHLYCWGSNSAGQLGNAASPGGTPGLVADPM